MKLLTLLTTLVLTTAFAYSQNTNISGTINSYASVSAIVGTTVTVPSSAGFTIGSQVLLVQMQGAVVDESNTSSFGTTTAIGSTGNYEFASVCDVPNGTEIVLNSIQRTYDPSNSVQLVLVPEFVDATITGTLTASPWNGSTGGILVFECSGTLTMNNGIDLQGSGFRGGSVTTSTYSCNWFAVVQDFFYDITSGEGAMKGEGISQYIPTKTGGQGAQANAGGGGNDHNSGGGGGANAGSGGQGGERISATAFTCSGQYPGLGGYLNSYSNAENKVFLGGGGGAGHENNLALGTPGSSGGGIVMIKANTINGGGQTINVQGEATGANANDGAGGGGAGGTVLLQVANYSGSLSVNVNGTDGGTVDNVGTSNCNGPGGGGGGGILWVNQASVPANITLTSAGGLCGITNSASQANCTINGTNNATNGTSGTSLTGLNLFQSTCSPVPINQVASVCQSDSVLLEGAWQNTAGVYYDTVFSACCNTVYVTTLSVNTESSFGSADYICTGDSIFVQNAWQTTTGLYTDSLSTINGCDSIVQVDLTVYPELIGSVNSTICSDDSVVVNGTVYNAANPSGVEVFTNVGFWGCDSTVTINLTITTVDASVLSTPPIITAGATGVSYQWLDCNNNYSAMPSDTNQIYSVSFGGMFAVEITDNGCVDTSVCVMGYNGLFEFDNEIEGIEVYPNPTNGEFSIDLGLEYDNVKVSISDLTGEVIKERTFSHSQYVELNLNESTGMYFITIEIGEERSVLRLIKN